MKYCVDNPLVCQLFDEIEELQLIKEDAVVNSKFEDAKSALQKQRTLLLEIEGMIRKVLGCENEPLRE